MKRVILTSSSGLCLVQANLADMVAPLVFRFVWGALPTPDHLAEHLGGRSSTGPEVHWSNFVGRSALCGLAHKGYPLLWVFETYAVDLIDLWFGPDPNDQLQLIWILDYLRFDPSLLERLRLRAVDFSLPGVDPAELRKRTVRESPIAENDLEIATLAWEAYCAPTPELCFGLLDRPLGKLCFLKPAMEDLLAELPSTTTGLGATETRLLELIASGRNRTDELFRPGARGIRVFDQWELGSMLEGLAFGPTPALAGLDGKLAMLDPNDTRSRNAAFRRSRLSLTEFGKAVLEGREDFRRHNPIKRWWGGTLLTNERLWRWDRESRSLVAP